MRTQRVAGTERHGLAQGEMWEHVGFVEGRVLIDEDLVKVVVTMNLLYPWAHVSSAQTRNGNKARDQTAR